MQVNGNSVNSSNTVPSNIIIETAGDKITLSDYKHRRDKCMKCAKPPEYEVLWVEGMAHAWFCERHLKEWLKASVASCAKEGFSNKNCELNSLKKLDNKEASMKFGENKNANLLNSFLSKIPMPEVNKEKKKEIEEEMGEVESIGLSDSEELAPVYSSGVELGEEIKLEALLPYFKSFYRTKPYISLIGGICNWGKTKGDIDFFISAAHRDIATEFRIYRMFPREYWYRFSFRYPFQEETHPGKFTDHLDIYNEKIEVISPRPELVLMSSQKKVELFKFIRLLKPTHGHYKGEEYSVEKLIEVVNAKPEWYEKGIYVQKKFDGVHVRCDVQRHYESGFSVRIWTEEGNEIRDKLPTLVAALGKASKGHAMALVGELEFWKETHQSRQETTAIIHTKEVHPEEKGIVLNVFDLLFYNKEDIHREPYTKRLERLRKRLGPSENIQIAQTSLVENERDLKEAVKKYAGMPGSEGAYLKRADFPYELDGKTQLNLKYKNTFSWDVAVKSIDKIKGANAWSYLCVIEDEHGEEVPCGKSYNCSIGRSKTESLREGDILKIEFVNLNKYIDPKTKKVWYNMWSPRPIPPWREEKKKPDNTLTAEKLVEASHGTVAEKSWPKRYEDAYPIEDSDQYSIHPDESKKWKGMVHIHGRGKSVHCDSFGGTDEVITLYLDWLRRPLDKKIINDLRFQISKDWAIGWTLFIPKGLSKVPENHDEFKRLVDTEIMPIIKETMANPMKKFNCGKKALEPMEWLSYQGMVQPGQVGATKNEPGFFYIIDSFDVQFGASKSYFHEYFCNGKIFNGRLVFRLLENKEEWKKTDEGLMTWMMFNALKSPTPYVISARAVKKNWIPPLGVSALPKNIRTKIPNGFQYWKIEDASKRREIRDELVALIKEKLLKLDSVRQGKFKFLKQTWRGQKVIRRGPSRTVYYLILKHHESYFSLALNTSILTSHSAAGLPFSHHIPLWTTEGEIKPETKLNPSKATPSEMVVLDQGTATILNGDNLKTLVFQGKKLKGTWKAFQQEDSSMWSLEKLE